MCLVRRIINGFRQLNKSFLTIKGILQKLKEAIQFTGSERCLRQIVKKLGYRWCKSNRKILKGKYDIVSWHLRFIRSIRQYRNEGRPIIYMDETWLNSCHTMQKTWSCKNESFSSSENTLSIPENKGPQLIICHAGDKMGFIENGLLIYKSKQKSRDYQDEMNGQILKGT